MDRSSVCPGADVDGVEVKTVSFCRGISYSRVGVDDVGVESVASCRSSSFAEMGIDGVGSGSTVISKGLVVSELKFVLGF